MRFGILRTKTVAGANVGGLILGTATFSMFLMLTCTCSRCSATRP